MTRPARWASFRPGDLSRRLALYGALILAAYWSTLDNYFTSDDFMLLAPFHTQPVSGWGLIPHRGEGFFRPLPRLLWGVDYALWGRWPLGYHAVHLALHALTSLQVYRLGRLYLSSEVATVAGMLFALHPLLVEPVAWVSASFDLLATLLILSGLVAWVSGRLAQGSCLFVLALLSKESALVFPLLVVMLGSRLEGRRPGPRHLAILGGITLGYLALRVWLLGDLGGYRTLGGVPHAYRPDPGGMVRGFLFSLSLVVYPVNRFLVPSFPLLFVLLSAVTAIPWAGLLVGRRPRPGVLWSLGFAGIAYLPVSILHGVHLHGSSRFLYLPTVGIALALAALLASLPWPRLLVASILAADTALIFLNLIPWETAARESFENTRALLSVQQTLPRDRLVAVLTPTHFMNVHLYGNALPHALELYADAPFKVVGLSPEDLELAKSLGLLPRDVMTYSLNRPPIRPRWPTWHPVWTKLPR